MDLTDNHSLTHGFSLLVCLLLMPVCWSGASLGHLYLLFVPVLAPVHPFLGFIVWKFFFGGLLSLVHTSSIFILVYQLFSFKFSFICFLSFPLLRLVPPFYLSILCCGTSLPIFLLFVCFLVFLLFVCYLGSGPVLA